MFLCEILNVLLVAYFYLLPFHFNLLIPCLGRGIKFQRECVDQKLQFSDNLLSIFWVGKQVFLGLEQN